MPQAINIYFTYGLRYKGDKRSYSLIYSEESLAICTYFEPDPWDASPCFEEEDKVKGLSQSTFIILSLHFLPDESTSTFTVFKRWQNSWKHKTTIVEIHKIHP